MSTPNPATIAAANALSGERTFQTVSFPLTGDAQLDAISGCLAVLNGMFGQEPPHFRHSVDINAKLTVLQFLLTRFTKELEQEKQSEAAMRGISQAMAAPTAFPPAPQPYVTTSGSISSGPASGQSTMTMKDRTLAMLEGST